MSLDTIPVPVPEAGELLVRVQAIPLNLNDMERINGENMMVRPELPVTPGMEVMGIVAACGDHFGKKCFFFLRFQGTTRIIGDSIPVGALNKIMYD